MTSKEKDIGVLLSFFDSKKYDLEEVGGIIYELFDLLKNKPIHQAGCAWAIMILYRRGKCSSLQIEDLIDEFYEYCGGYDEYIDSIVLGEKIDAQLTFYNSFVHKKVKGV